MLSQSPKPGHLVVIRAADGVIHGEANLSVGRAAQRIEADLARVQRKRNGTFEYQFVQLGPASDEEVLYSLQVRLDPTIVLHRTKDARWRSFVEECRSQAPGRAPAEVSEHFGALTYKDAKCMTVRALIERMSRFGRHATVSFATIDGGDIGTIVESHGTELQVPLEVVVEVTMDVSVLSELASSITALDMGGMR